MKKRIIMASLVLVLSVPAAFSWGLGAAFSIDAMGGLPSSALLSVRTPDQPIVLGVGVQLSQEHFNLGMTADWWLVHNELTNIISYYIGPGLYLVAPETLEVGGRVPVGLQVFPIEPLELFLEIAPAQSLVTGNGVQIPDISVQSAFGFRFWF